VFYNTTNLIDIKHFFLKFSWLKGKTLFDLVLGSADHGIVAQTGQKDVQLSIITPGVQKSEHENSFLLVLTFSLGFVRFVRFVQIKAGFYSFCSKRSWASLQIKSWALVVCAGFW
jgi:hypothetical protein